MSPDQPDPQRPEHRGGALRRTRATACRCRHHSRSARRSPQTSRWTPRRTGPTGGTSSLTVPRWDTARSRPPRCPTRRCCRCSQHPRCRHGWADAVGRDAGRRADLHVAHRRHPGVLLDAPADTAPSPTIGGVPWYALSANEPHSSHAAAEGHQDRHRLLRRARHALRRRLAGAQGPGGLRLHRRPGAARRGEPGGHPAGRARSTARRRRGSSTAARRSCARALIAIQCGAFHLGVGGTQVLQHHAARPRRDHDGDRARDARRRRRTSSATAARTRATTSSASTATASSPTRSSRSTSRGSTRRSSTRSAAARR